MSKKLSHTDVADRHRDAAATFTARVEGVRNWDAPTPVAEWTTRDIVRHLVDWSRGLFGGAEGVTFAEVPSVDVDPVGCWRHHTEQMQALLDTPAVEKIDLDNQYLGKQPLLQAIDQYYVPDVFMHTWDIAKASGQESGLDQAACHSMLQEMEKNEVPLRASGQFGQRVRVGRDAASDEKLAAFIGRDPYWVPPVA